LSPKLSERPLIHDGCEITDCTLGTFVEIGAGTRMSNVVMGDYSYSDRTCDISNARIGKFANIASFVRIGAPDHPLDGPSCHHFLYRSGDYWEDATHDTGFFARRAARVAVIGHDTWIGHGAMIKPGITVADGAVVAAGAVVTHDVAPYVVVSGIPARPLRPRQPPEIAARLIALAWWDWDHARLRSALEDFRSLSALAFLERYGG